MKVNTIGLVLLTSLAFGCQVDDGQSGDAFDRQAEVDEIVDNLLLADYPEHEIEVTEDGTVYAGRDAVVSLEASREIAGLTADGTAFRQYRTNNLISSSITKICVNPNAKFAGNAVLMAALSDAVAEYNSQGLQFSMQVGGNGCDASITAKEVQGTGGSAGFPSGGNPYGTINIGKGIAQYGQSVVKHVVVHELGHCIGFRHSDYFDRSYSCGGSATNEGASNVGAVHISGTPTGFTSSVMNSCYNLQSNGNFTSSDSKALTELYTGGGGGGGGGGGNGGGKGKPN